MQAYRNNYKKPSDIPNTEIPPAFDLRNVHGQDFTGVIRSQGSCGSCHAMGFIQQVESRLKVKYGVDPGALSVQQTIKCNYLTEGCKGGWSILHGYFFENGAMVSEECAPYTGKIGSACKSFSQCKGIARVSRTYMLKNPTP